MAGYREVRRFAMPAGQEPGAVKGMADQVRALAWSPDGKMIAAGGGTPGAFGELVLIDAATGSVILHVGRPSRLRLPRRVQPRRQTARVVRIRQAHSHLGHGDREADGRAERAHGSGVCRRLQRVRDSARVGLRRPIRQDLGRVERRPAVHDQRSHRRDAHAGVPARARTICSPAAPTSGCAPGRSATRRRLRLRNTLAHTAGIIRLAFSPDGARLATSSTDRQVKLWSAADLRELRQFGAQSDWAQSLAFSRDGTELAVGRYDGTVSVFDAGTGRRVVDLISVPAPVAVARGVGRND